jgi:hypothetical protein
MLISIDSERQKAPARAFLERTRYDTDRGMGA